MRLHIVGIGRGANIRLAPLTPFTFVRELKVPAAPQVLFEEVRFSCQAGADAHRGRRCLGCSHYRGHAERDDGGFTVRCAFGDQDPVWSRMTTAGALVSVRVDASTREADRVAVEEGVHHLPVVAGGWMVGLVCRCDLGGPETPVAQRMRREVYAIEARTTLGEAAAAFDALHVGCLPVVSRGLLVGILTRDDLATALQPSGA